MLAATLELRKLPEDLLFHARVDNTVQLIQLFAIVENDRTQAAAVDVFVCIENLAAEPGNHFPVSGVPRLDHLMRHLVGFKHWKA